MTTITITDPELIRQLTEAVGPIEFRDPAGNVVYFAGGELWAPPEGYVPPIPMEELERRSRTYRSGSPLSEIMKRLKGES